MKTTLQKLGKSLSAMVMPNIGAFIAWGFITALFIADELACSNGTSSDSSKITNFSSEKSFNMRKAHDSTALLTVCLAYV